MRFPFIGVRNCEVRIPLSPPYNKINGFVSVGGLVATDNGNVFTRVRLFRLAYPACPAFCRGAWLAAGRGVTVLAMENTSGGSGTL